MRARSALLRASLFLALIPGILPAQSVGRMLENDLRNFGGDIWSVWTSPFRADARDWLTAGIVVAGSAAVMPLDDNIDRWMVKHQNSALWSPLKELRQGGKGFSGKYITPAAGGVLIYALATKNTKIQEGIFGCLASYVSGSVVRNYVLYALVGRERPNPRKDSVTVPPAEEGDQYNFTVPGEFDNWGMHSMPAGHAANILACASFLNNRFEMGYVEPALYLVSAGIGVGRLVDRRHWTSDTFVGLAFGYAIGRHVAHRSANRALKSSTAVGAAAATMLEGVYVTPSRHSLTVGWKTTF
ncbi:MAG TPA: phosphatase PAP2 family protein [Gemmatimonadaceae bacterium]|nr:phosphatase PAP2 family protein [Gemmatimonadaceae bacterium]